MKQVQVPTSGWNSAVANKAEALDAVTNGSVAGCRSVEAWRAFFASYSHIVLVANSEDQRFEELRETLPETALFVFFNRVEKVISEPFSGNSLLVTRSNQAGSELVYRGLVGKTTALLAGPGFAGVLNLRTAFIERMNEIADFGAVPAGLLDLASYFEEFYPPGHTASSGFAMALWLCENVPGSKIILTGFSAQRGTKWKLFHIHDWTFEQTCLRVLAIKDKLSIDGPDARDPYALLTRRFPDIETRDIAFGVAQTLSLRLEASNRQIDRLVSITAPLRAAYDLFRALKRKSKKERVLAERRKQGMSE